MKELIFYGHIKGSKALANYVSKYEMVLKGEPENTYGYLAASMDKLIAQKRERANKESCAAGQLYQAGRKIAPAANADVNEPSSAGGKKCYNCCCGGSSHTSEWLFAFRDNIEDTR